MTYQPPAPYRPETMDLVRADHAQRVSLTITAGSSTWTVQPLSGRLTLSESWAPSARLDAELAAIFSPADLRTLDPRTKLITVTITAGYLHATGELDAQTVATLLLDARPVRQPAAVMSLAASSEETRVIESAWMAAEAWQPYLGVVECIEALLSYARGRSITLETDIPLRYRSDLTTSIHLETGASLWSVLDDLTAAADLRLFLTEAGNWALQPKPTVAGLVSAYLSKGRGGIAGDSTDDLSRNGYYDAAVVLYEWRDAGGTDRRIIGTYGSPSGKVYSTRKDFAIGQSAANAAAKTYVRALSTRGSGYVVQAVACWWLRPGHTVEVTLEDGTTVRHIAQEIEFDLAASTMTVTTREPSNLGTEP